MRRHWRRLVIGALLIAYFIGIPLIWGNWLAGAGPALVVVAVVYATRWRRRAPQ